MSFDVVVVGGGFFGASLATHFARNGRSVAIVEREKTLLQKASLRNQARIHGGYHYPRSYLTASRSQANFRRFIREYSEVVIEPTASYYPIARHFSAISAAQFKLFCERISAPCYEDKQALKSWFESAYIEKVFAVEEFAFDANRLRSRCVADLGSGNVQTFLQAEVLSLREEFGDWTVEFRQDGAHDRLMATNVIVASYSEINNVLRASSLPPTPLIHQQTEMALVRPPPGMENTSVTIMDGPFWSYFPYPSRASLHTLSHVRYTPHRTWLDHGGGMNDFENTLHQSSHALLMIRDAQRMMPALRPLEHVESLWETKTLLPRSAQNDSRPILFSKDHGRRGLHLVLGGKIDNVFDIIEEVGRTFG